jgi:hypothetical protein
VTRFQAAQRFGRAKAIPGEFQAASMPQRLAWPAAALVIVGLSLLLWSSIGAILVWFLA